MGFIGYVGLVIVCSIIFSILEKKYEVKARYRYYDGFRRKLKATVVFAITALIITFIILRKFQIENKIFIDITQVILVIPILLYSWVKTEDPKVSKEEEKKIDFCYYCGGSLDEDNFCQSCGKEIEK